MKPFRLSFLVSTALLGATVAWAQFGGFDLSKIKKGLDTAKDAGKVLKGVAGIGPEEERNMGESVALELIGKYGGVVRDADTMRRVNLVGRSLTKYSDRPQLSWRFAVLDSDTINAFSAPDGYVFITKALYEQATNDDLLAVLVNLQEQGENRKTMFSTHPPLAERIKHLPDEPAPAAPTELIATATDAKN